MAIWARDGRIAGIATQVGLVAGGIPVPGLPTLVATLFKLLATLTYLDAIKGGAKGDSLLASLPKVAAPGTTGAKGAGVMNPAQVRTELHVIRDNRVAFQAWSASRTNPKTLEQFREQFDAVFKTERSERGADKIDFEKFEKMKAALPSRIRRPVDDLLVQHLDDD